MSTDCRAEFLNSNSEKTFDENCCPDLTVAIICACQLVCVLRFLRFKPYQCHLILMEGYSVRPYVDDGGWGVPEVVVRQERPIGLGLPLVRELGIFYPAESATLTPLTMDTIRVDVPVEQAEGEPAILAKSEVFHLKRHVYF
jgi:hypothetical protein